MLKADDFDFSTAISPIKITKRSKNNNESFDLISFNDSNNAIDNVTIKSNEATRKDCNGELDDLLEVSNAANDSEDFW